jgi:hypothetical protein
LVWLFSPPASGVPRGSRRAHPYQACFSYALFAARASDAQLNSAATVTVVVRSMPGLPARCGTRAGGTAGEDERAADLSASASARVQGKARPR